MIKHFVKNQISKVLNEFDRQLVQTENRIPLDIHLRTYFKTHKSLGSTDRKVISENVYKLVRNQVYLDTISPKPLTWDTKIETMLSPRFKTMKDNKSLHPNVRCSCPKSLFQLVADAYGQGKAIEYLQNINHRAPLTIRVNPYKISRDQLLHKWQKLDKYAVKKTQFSPYGIQFTTNHNVNLFDLPEFKKGYFEIQDEASQLTALRIQCKPGDKILDYCAGSAGKTLAFAPQTKGAGKIYVHDIREKIINVQAKKRLKRAGIINIELMSEKKELKKLKNRMNWVVVDAPCTGTGTLRRNPDLKNKFTADKLDYYTQLQKGILKEAIQYMKPDGKLVYITCSLLPQENLFQIQQFCEENDMQIVDGKHFQTLPENQVDMDSFFSATIEFKNQNETKQVENKQYEQNPLLTEN